jgi:hypothetical protein
MISRAALVGALLALFAGAGPVVAQEAEESVNLRVREIVKSGQGVLLPLDDIFGTAGQDTDDMALSTQDGATDDSALSEGGDEPIEPIEQTQTVDDVVAPEAAEVVDVVEEIETAGTEADAGSDWPPPAEEVEVPEFDQPAAVEEIIVEDVEPASAEPEADPDSGDGQTLDAGLVPLRTAELGNPETIGPYRLWLASYKTVRQAKEAWQGLALANQDLLADLTPIIVLKDLGAEEGTFFRLQAGPLQTQASAVERCESLQERSLYCSVLGP